MKFSRLLTLGPLFLLTLLTSACTTKTYEAAGSYSDEAGIPKNIYLQYNARYWYLPFVGNDEIGSIIVSDNCSLNDLLNSEFDSVHGLVFWEDKLDYNLVDQAPVIELRDGEFVCAKLKQGTKLEGSFDGDTLILETYCVSINPRTPIIPVSLDGHELILQSVKKLSCPKPLENVTNE